MTVMTLESAEAVARSAHERQLDRIGMPYFETHAQDVQQRVAAAGGDEDQQIAALLHDVLEDTQVTEADLRAQGVSEATMRILLLMTKQEGQDASLYLQRIADYGAARQVKLADIASNTDPVRLDRLDPERRRTLLTKYIGYLDALGADAGHLHDLLAAVPATETDQERQERLDRVLDERMAARLDQLVDEDDFIVLESPREQV